MTRNRWCAPFLFLLGLMLFSGDIRAQTPTGPVIWTTGAMERTGLEQVPGDTQNVTLQAARGEYEAFQIGVHAPDTGLTGVNLKVTDLIGDFGTRIPASSFMLYREHYVYVSASSPDREGSNRPQGVGWYPDALIPFHDPHTGFPPSGAEVRAVPVDIPAGQNQPFWVDLYVPRFITPGTYIGAFTVTSDQGTANGTISLRVWDFELPLKPSLNSVFDIERQDYLANQVELLKHKLMPMVVDPGDERYLIDVWGLTSTNLGFWNPVNYPECAMEPAPTTLTLMNAASLHEPDLTLYNYTADEINNCMPDIAPQVRMWGHQLHTAKVNQLITMTPASQLLNDGSGTGRSAVDWWVMLPKMMDTAPEQVEAALAKGDQVWLYVALVQDDYSPKWQIDFAPMNYRIPGLINQSLGVTGIFYWSVNRWTDDPWNDVQTHHSSSSAYPGEGMLVYPGEPLGMHTFVPSMRLKWIREGIEDYEYIQLLKDLGYEQEALARIKPVAADWMHWSDDPAALDAVRFDLGNRIETLTRAALLESPQ